MEKSTSNSFNVDEYKKYRNQLVINYISLRVLLGVLGLLLPIILLVGSVIANESVIQSAISDYFHTPLRQFFTIILGAISLLLFAYQGYNAVDKWVTNAAGLFGLLTAFVFTSFKPNATLHGYSLSEGNPRTVVPLDQLEGGPFEIIPSPVSDLQGYLHLAFASLFFLLLAWMALFQFTKAGKPGEKWTYRICGFIMIAAIAGMSPLVFGSDALKEFYSKYLLVFWGESICLWAFGISWLVKALSSQRRNKRKQLKAAVAAAEIIERETNRITVE